MKFIRTYLLLTGIFFLGQMLSAQHTFSIVAVDTLTGEVGSAGASCLDNSNISGGVLIISDVFPGRGAIHTQASWLPANQQTARTRILAGDSPQEIIDFLVANDAGVSIGSGDATNRQYGIVDFDSSGQARSAAYTGINCLDYKNHITGPGYSIQGNILLGQQILDSMEHHFLTTPGNLGDRLMAALQGANVPGADTRCLSEGVSSLSAFLRVARPYDPYGNYYLDLLVGQTPFGVEPIDALQSLYDSWSPPDCGFAVPADAVVIASDSALSVSGKVLWVCTGDTVTLNGNNNVVLLEPGAYFLGAGGSNNQVFLKDSAGISGGNSILTKIYHSLGSRIVHPGLAPKYVSCDSVYFTYTEAPANGCIASSTSVDTYLNRSLFSVFPNPSGKEVFLSAEDQIQRKVFVKWFDIQGKCVLTEKVQMYGGESVLRTPEKKGLYLLEIQYGNTRWSRKHLIE
ncbi:MAG: DUF1028 domain-containing protein [Bacteroidia bacterium]